MIYSSFLLSQSIAHLPLLAASLLGIVLAVIFWSRSPLSAGMVFAAALLLLLASIGAVFGQWQLILAQQAGGWTAEEQRTAITVLSLSVSAARALAFGLAAVAAFVDRCARTTA